MNLFRIIHGAWLSQWRRRIHPQPSSRPLSGPYQPQVEKLETRLCPSSLSFKLDTIFVRGPGLNTLSDIQKHLPLAPLIQVDQSRHIWFLGANIELREGATLLLHGTTIGGDTNELRLMSNNSWAPGSQVHIAADWGTIDINNTTITSWNNAVNGPDREYLPFHRAFIQARSSLNADGVTADESRMNIANSDIGFLGFNSIESYGLSWKVNVATPDLYEKVHVFGEVTNSRIHDCFRGPYTFGGYGMRFLNNEIDHNASYGLDIYSYSNYTDIEGNSFHDNVKHGLIVVRSDHVTIKNNISQNNLLDGIMLYLNVNNTLVQDNQILNNKRNGIGVTDSHWNTLSGNTIIGNVNGITLSVGSSDNVVSENTIAWNTGNGLNFYRGRVAPSAGDGRPKHNYFVRNTIQNNTGDGIRLADADNNVFASNTFSGNSRTFLFERGVGNTLIGNQIPRDVVVYTKGSATFESVTYISNQPSIQVKVDEFSSVVFIDENRTVTKPRVAAEHQGRNEFPAAGAEGYLRLQHTVHSLARGVDHVARAHFTATQDSGFHGDHEEPSWPDGRVFVAHPDGGDSKGVDSKPGEIVVDALVDSVNYGEERLLSVFNALDELVLAVSELNVAEPELLALLGRLIPGPSNKLTVADGSVTMAGVDDILMDNLGVVIGITAAGTGLLAVLRTIKESRSVTVRKDGWWPSEARSPR
jgi:parallel beta-helix repeat protein